MYTAILTFDLEFVSFTLKIFSHLSLYIMLKDTCMLAALFLDMCTGCINCDLDIHSMSQTTILDFEFEILDDSFRVMDEHLGS